MEPKRAVFDNHADFWQSLCLVISFAIPMEFICEKNNLQIIFTGEHTKPTQINARHS